MADQRTWLRYGGVAGIAFVVLNLVSAFLPGAPPKPDAPIADIRAYYVDHRSAILLGAYLSGIAAVASLWFIGVLRGLLRGDNPESETLAAIVFGSGLITNAMALLGTVVVGALAMGPHRDDTTLRVLTDMSDAGFAALYFPWALFNFATGVAILRNRVFASWLGWSGLVVGAVFLVAAAGLGTRGGALAAGGPVSFIALVFGMLWGLAVSIATYRAGSDSRRRAAVALA